MASKVVLLSPSELAAAQAFNARMAAANAPSDYIPERLAPAPPHQLITRTQYVVLDGAEVRGGVANISYPIWLNRANLPSINFQSPISEGIIDKKYGMTAMLLVKFMQQQGPHLFIVGMGDERNPLPRLLKAASWTVQSMPFFYFVCRPNRFLSELQLLQRDPKRRLAATLAASTGTGWLAIRAIHAHGIAARIATGGHAIESVPAWDSWADALWQKFRESCSFGVLRDRKTLDELYPTSDPRILRFVVRRNGQPAAWCVCFLSAMNNHNYFGNMKVATILDCVAEPGSEAPTVALALKTLRAAGADIVITNQTHRVWLDAFRRTGFRTAKSNYQLAMSPTLAKEAGPFNSIHVTRGDGDGRIHL